MLGGKKEKTTSKNDSPSANTNETRLARKAMRSHAFLEGEAAALVEGEAEAPSLTCSRRMSDVLF